MIFYCKQRFLMDCEQCTFQVSSPGVTLIEEDVEPGAAIERVMLAKAYADGGLKHVNESNAPPELLPTLQRLNVYLADHKAHAHPVETVN
jgi:hypothetical protein